MRLSIFTVAAAALVTLTACASGPTGPDAAGRFDSFEAVVTNDFTGYDKVYIKAPTAGPEIQARIGSRRLLARTRRDRPIDQRDVDKKLEDLHQDLERALGRRARLVDESGPGVLTITTVVTQLDANRPTQAELAAEPGLSLQSIDAGDAAVMITLSENGRVLARLRDSDNITSINDPGFIPVAVWGTADQFFGQLSNKLADLISG